ncbi:hypothetical protein HDV00_009739 [Rhizophlyctis rosea]|nr:hypothetical protein HDV00_009739 [Rhizophlyctis rosea]
MISSAEESYWARTLTAPFTPEPLFKVHILPGPNNSFISGLPGITPFSIHATIRVTNTHKTKQKHIKSIRILLAGDTQYSWQGGQNNWRGSDFNFDIYVEHKEDLLVVGEGVSKVVPLGPGESEHGEARTRYTIEARVFMAKSGLLGSESEPIKGTTNIPFVWYSPDSLEEIIRLQDLDPKPGFSFTNGFTFNIDGPIEFSAKLHDPRAVKSLHLTIDQTILCKPANSSKGLRMHYPIFTWSHHFSNPDTTTTTHTFAPLLTQFTKKHQTDPAILPTRRRPQDKIFHVHHRMQLKVELGTRTYQLTINPTIVPWKRQDLVDFVRENPVVVREVVHGFTPEYLDIPWEDAPEYQPAPAYG